MEAIAEAQSAKSFASDVSPEHLLKTVNSCLDNHKAEDIVSIDLSGKSSIADFMVIASGRSQRQVGALADYLIKDLKKLGIKDIRVQGLDQSDWVLIDTGDAVIHIFRPEVRDFYNLDKMWATDLDAPDAVN